MKTDKSPARGPESPARRNFLAAGSAVALGASGVALGASQADAYPHALLASDVTFDAETDILVVGGGGAGLPTALFSRWLGNEVIVLEKALVPGGTAQKAAFWYWVPNNPEMQAKNIPDPKEDYLRYVARLSHPERYNAALPKLGLSDWEYSMCEAIYDSGAEAVKLLHDKKALVYRHVPGAPDYFAELPEDKAPTGRVLIPAGASESMADGGAAGIANMVEACGRDGVEIRTRHRVTNVISNVGGEIVGVEAEAPSGPVRIRARKAVIFATGGYTHNVQMRRDYLAYPVFGGCAALSNEGDFITIAKRLGADLGNLNYAWFCPLPLEKAVAKDPGISGIFSNNGDSLIFVNRYGRRAMNEKLQYNELAQEFFRWDGPGAEYPNLVMMAVWDQHAQDTCANSDYGRLIVPEDGDTRHYIRGNTLEELAKGIAERLTKYAEATGGLALAPDFVQNLRASIERFNTFAANGKDEDFHRGERIVQMLFNGPVAADQGSANATMYPIADKGPYYAALVCGGTLDTKGGPRTTSEARVLGDDGTPIAGLFGVGNCVASASGRAYWAGGGTLGPIMAFAYRAANAAHAEGVKTI